MVFKKFICLFLFISLVDVANSQTPTVDGKQLVLDYIDKMGQFKRPLGEEVYFMDVKLTNLMKDIKLKPTVANVKVYLSSKLLIYNSDLVSEFQDDKECFVVVYQDKKIYRRNATNTTNEALKMTQIAQFQKELLSHSTLVSNRSVDMGGRKMQSLKFKIEDELSKRLKIETVEFVYSEEKKSIAKIMVSYNSTNPVTVQQIEYNNLDFNYKGAKITGSANGFIFDKKGNLQNSYKGFQIIDNRIK